MLFAGMIIFLRHHHNVLLRLIHPKVCKNAKRGGYFIQKLKFCTSQNEKMNFIFKINVFQYIFRKLSFTIPVTANSFIFSVLLD